MDEVEAARRRDELRRRLGHDLVVFKDYVERSGLVDRKPTRAEEAAFEHGVEPQGRQAPARAAEQ